MSDIGTLYEPASIEDAEQNYELIQAYDELSVLWQVSEVLSQAHDLDKILKIILTGVTANQGLGFNQLSQTVGNDLTDPLFVLGLCC